MPLLDTNLSTLVQQSQQVTVSCQRLDVMSQSLRQPTQQVQRNDHKIFVRSLVCIRI